MLSSHQKRYKENLSVLKEISHFILAYEYNKFDAGTKFFMLNKTPFLVILSFDGTIAWKKQDVELDDFGFKSASKLYSPKLSFNDVFEQIPDDIREEFLFYLHVFRR